MKFRVGSKVLIKEVTVLDLEDDLDGVFEYVGEIGKILSIDPDQSYGIKVKFKTDEDPFYAINSFHAGELIKVTKTTKILFGKT